MQEMDCSFKFKLGSGYIYVHSLFVVCDRHYIDGDCWYLYSVLFNGFDDYGNSKSLQDVISYMLDHIDLIRKVDDVLSKYIFSRPDEAFAFADKIVSKYPPRVKLKSDDVVFPLLDLSDIM